MTRTPCHRTNLIAEAEALALHAVDATRHERAAYRAWFLSDPHSRPTYERARATAHAQQYATLDALLNHVGELCREGLSEFAINLWKSTVKRCEVAIDVAAFDLFDEIHRPDRKESIPREAGTLPSAPPRRAEEEDRLPRLQAPDRGGEAGRPFELRLAPAPSQEGGLRCG